MVFPYTQSLFPLLRRQWWSGWPPLQLNLLGIGRHTYLSWWHFPELPGEMEVVYSPACVVNMSTWPATAAAIWLNSGIAINGISRTGATGVLSPCTPKFRESACRHVPPHHSHDSYSNRQAINVLCMCMWLHVNAVVGGSHTNYRAV